MRMNFVATDDVKISNFESTGTLPKNVSNAGTSINTNGYVTVKEIPHYSVSEGNSTLSGATLTGLSNKVYEGNDVTITIGGVSNSYSIKLTDNGVDVSDKLISGLQYVIENISANHVLVVSLQDTITITTSSSYNGASLSPASATAYKGEPVELTLSVSDISLVSVRVTNSKTSMVTGIFEDNGNVEHLNCYFVT